MRRTFAILCLLAAMARADDKRAEALFEEGRKLAKAGKYQEACDKFEQALAITPAGGTEMNLADCYEHLGEIKRAYDLFEKVATESLRDNKIDRAKLARKRADALASKLPAPEPTATPPPSPSPSPSLSPPPPPPPSPSLSPPPPPPSPPPPEPAQPPPGSTHATFASGSELAWDVTIGGRLACTTPCDAWVPPNHLVELDSRDDDHLHLDPGAISGREVTITADPTASGKHAVGITFTVVSGAGVVTGITLAAIGCSTDNSGMCWAGAITGVPSAIGLYLSIALLRSSGPKLHVKHVQPYATGTQVGIAGRF